MQLLRISLICLTILVGIGLLTSFQSQMSFAQEQTRESITEDWERTAARAEESVEAARASTAAFETLRADLVSWRELFQASQRTNATTIATVQQQLDALGPVPESGTEAEDIAAQRQTLNNRLAELQAPVKSAEVAYNRADALIRAIDGIIRDRQAEELFEFGPSPLNPVHWLPALNILRLSAAHIRGEFVVAWSNPLQKVETTEALPAVIVLLLMGSILVVRGRNWSRRLTNWALGEAPGAGRWIAGFVLSMCSLILPLLGVFLLIRAVYATGLVGLRTEQLLETIPPATFAFLFARWLAMRIFPAKEARTLPLNLDESQRKAGRWYGAMLGLVAGVYLLIEEISVLSSWPIGASNALLFPFLLTAGLLLLRIAGLLRSHSKNAAASDGEETYRTRLTRLIALALAVLSFTAPALAAIGYFRLAHFMMFPSLASLQLLAALLVLQRVVIEAYVLITDNREGASQSLIPVLIGFLLVMLSLPIFALIWGARVADLTELWTQAMDGFDIGGLRLSPTIFLTFAIVFVIGYTATRLLQGALKNTVLPKTRIDAGGRTAIVSGIGYVGIFLAAVIAITSAGIDLSSIAIVAGALSVGIGFGLQNIVSNFVSGIILLIERPIANGDWIEVGGVHGTVRQISVRSTIIETFDRSDVIVPNSDLVSGRVTNYTRGNTVGRVIVAVGVAYGTDTRRVEQILREVAEAHPMVLLSSPPAVVFRAFGADSLEFEIRAILRDVNWVLSVHSDMNHEIARRFAEEGIEVPFAQRDIWIRNPETLTNGAAGGGAPAPTKPSYTSGDPKDARAHLTDDDLPDGARDVGGDGDGR